MKTQLLFCFTVLSLLTGFKTKAVAGNPAHNTGAFYSHTKNSNSLYNAPKHSAVVSYMQNSAYPLLRLKLVLDSFDYDDIAIAFNSSATTTYNNQIDSKYFPGINAAEGLASMSSDNVALSVNVVPLPAKAPLIIRLDVEAQTSGIYTLQRTQLDSIPQLYQIWLMDKYKKDSLDLRTNTNYIFSIDKKDSTSFGTGRFQVVIRQDPAYFAHLLSFTAKKAPNGCELAWTTENEHSSTDFTVERSIDGGATYYQFPVIASTDAGTYAFVDKNPVNGSDLYRLKMVDTNSTVIYSATVALSFGSSSTEAAPAPSNISIYPNPSNGMINLTITPTGISSSSTGFSNNSLQNYSNTPTSGTSSYDIKIANIKGTIIKTATSSSGSWQANMASLSPGTYIIQVINNSDKSIVGKSTFVKL